MKTFWAIFFGFYLLLAFYYLDAYGAYSFPIDPYADIKKMLLKHEGFRSRPYLDTRGFHTIGIGRNLDLLGITMEEGFFLLETDIKTVEKQLRYHLPLYDTLSRKRQVVLLDMVYNIGINDFLKFKRMIRALEARDYKTVAIHMRDSAWATQVPKRVSELAAMMETE